MTDENDRLTPLMRSDLRLWYLDQAAAVRDGKWSVVDREELAEHIEHRAGDLMRDAEIALRILIEASLEQDPLDAFEAQEEIRTLTRDAPSVLAELEKSYGDTYQHVLHMVSNLDPCASYPSMPPWSFAQLMDPDSWQRTEGLAPDEIHQFLQDLMCMIVLGALRPEIAPGWREHATFLNEVVAKSYRRSMLEVRPWIGVEERYTRPRKGTVLRELWRRASHEVIERCHRRSLAIPRLPLECPFSAEQLVARDLDMDEMLTFVRAWIET